MKQALEYRKHSIKYLAQFGVYVPEHLPVIDICPIRSLIVIQKKTKALVEEIWTAVRNDDQKKQAQIEALYVLAWALKIFEFCRITDECPDSLADQFPDGESLSNFMERTTRRSPDEILQLVDLYYCFDWAQLEKFVPKTLQILSSVDIMERRRALEWLCGGDWDDPDLDT